MTTMATEHTKRRWFWEKAQTMQHLQAEGYGALAVSMPLGTNKNYGRRDLLNATASLIEAAPDLLAALVESRRVMQLRLDELTVMSSRWVALSEAIAQADAAIAKARGAA